MKISVGQKIGTCLFLLGLLGIVITALLVNQCKSDINIFTGGSGVCSGLPVIAYHLRTLLCLGSFAMCIIGLIWVFIEAVNNA